MFKTVLNVDSHEDLIEAVKEVWASADDNDMAVIIQRQLDPEIAGVLFTRDPLTGKNETIIEYVEGSCDSLVSGRSEPSRIRIRNDYSRSDKHDAVSDGGVDFSPLLNTSKLLEEKFGYPLDSEWAYSDRNFHVLQARPITGLIPPGHTDSRTYSRVQAEQFYSGPVTPLFYSIFKTIYTRYYLAHTLEDLGIDIEIDDEFLIRHDNFLYVDTRIVEYGLGSLPRSGGLKQLRETVPEDIRDEQRTRKNLIPLFLKITTSTLIHRERWISRLDDEFTTTVVPEIISRLQEIGDPSVMDDRNLMDTYNELMKIMELHVNSSKWGIILYSIPLMGIVMDILHRHDMERYLPDLMSGFDGNRTMDVLDDIRYLASMARSNDRIMKVLSLDLRDYVSYREKIKETAGGERFIEFFENILKVYGHRRISRDIYQPSWNDDPMIPFSMVRKLALNMKIPDDGSTREAVIEKRRRAYRKIIGSLPLKYRMLFRFASRYLIRYTRFREFQRFYLDLILAGMKDLFIEISGRMVKEGDLDSLDDIFFLDISDVREWLSENVNERYREIAMFNKLSFDDVKRTPGRYLRGGLDFDTIKAHDKSTGDHEGTTIRGQPVASGVHRGRIFVAKDLDRHVRIEKDDILVTEYIDPGQTHIFLMAGALVLEVGGILSHGAILAREFNIPTVAGVRNATNILHDDQIAVVNGTRGTVTILK